MPIPRDDLSADRANNCPKTTAMPQGQPIGGEVARVFLHAWREKAQMQLHQDRDPAIVVNLKKEYQDFYESIGISRSAQQAKDALAAANPNKKRKQSVNPALAPYFNLLIRSL
jgi:hypothetical protein